MYKYMPLRMEFFDDPLIRLTPRSGLNDPFEILPSLNLSISSTIHTYGEGMNWDSQLSEHDNYLKNKALVDTSLNEKYSKIGIISLTSTHNNLLMWSHYANNHKGIVIEIGTHRNDSLLAEDFTYGKDAVIENMDKQLTPFGFKKRSEYLDFDLDLQPFLTHVRYDNLRPGADGDVGSNAELNFWIQQRVASCKSTSWNYEMESRIVSPTIFSDVAILKINEELIPKDDFGYPVDFAFHSTSLVTNISDALDANRIFNYRKTPRMVVVENNSDSIVCESIKKIVSREHVFHEVSPEILYFKRLKKNAISAIYFGAMLSEKDIKETLLRIMRSENIDHNGIVFYRGIISKTHYEVQFQKIGTEELPWDLSEDDAHIYEFSHILL